MIIRMMGLIIVLIMTRKYKKLKHSENNKNDTYRLNYINHNTMTIGSTSGNDHDSIEANDITNVMQNKKNYYNATFL